MPENDTPNEPDLAAPTHDEALAPVTTAPSAARVRQPKGPGKPRTRPPAPKKGPSAAERNALAALRAELAAARGELETTRAEVADVLESCRDAESRVTAVRAGADALRRFVAEIDASATTVRGLADAVAAEVERAREQSEQTEQRYARLREWLTDTRGEFAALDAEARRTLDHFRTAVEAVRTGSAPPEASEPPTTGAPASAEAVPALPEVAVLPPEERAADIRDRLIHLLNDAWGVEKEQATLLHALAEESGDRDLRAAFAEHAAACRTRQQVVQARLDALGATPSSERGLLGQLATRLWDAVRSPRDQADRAVLSVLKAVSAAEFQAGLYAAVHACASSAGGAQTAEASAELFREQTARAHQLRAALPATVGRFVRK